MAFKVADEQGLLLLDMKDLRAILSFIAEHAADLTTQYGNVSKQTVGTIQRQLLVLENQGADKFFGEPALSLKDFMRTDSDGRGMVGVSGTDEGVVQVRVEPGTALHLLVDHSQDPVHGLSVQAHDQDLGVLPVGEPTV